MHGKQASLIHPYISFIGEESVAGGANCEMTDKPTWIVDPIDGTTNFVHRYEEFALAIAVTTCHIIHYEKECFALSLMMAG